MSIYEFAETTIYQATVHGHLENGPPVTEPFPDWWPLRDQVYAAARGVILYEGTADFHVLHRFLDGSIGRTRWTIGADMLGPTLLWYEDTSGTSEINFRVTKRADMQQSRDDLTNPSWVDMRDLIPAVLGRQALGAGPVDIELDNYGTMVFTPQEIQYSRNGLDDIRDPYDSHIYGWTYYVEEDVEYEPAVWVVPAGQVDGAKLSVCIDSSANEWSDPDEPAPEFTPLPAPPDGP